MSNLQDMQDKVTQVTLGGQEYQARQLFARDWAQIEKEIKADGLKLSDIYNGEPTVIGYLSVIKASIAQEVPPRATHIEIFVAAAAILNLDLPEGEPAEKNSQQMQEVA